MAFSFNRTNNDLVDVCRVIVYHYDTRSIRLPVESRQQHRVQPIEEVRRFKIALFDPNTRKPAIDGHSNANTPCAASLNVSRIANILSNWPVSTISPSRLLVEYRFIKEDKVLSSILPHLFLPTLSQLIATPQRDPTQLLLCPFPPLQHLRDYTPMY